MDIVMIGPFAFRPKGTVRVRAFFIGRALVKRGHRVTIVLPPYDNLADSGRMWEQDGVRIVNVSMRGNTLWQQVLAPLRLARWTAQRKPDVVHVFKPIGYSGLAGAYLRWFSTHPLVLDTDDWEGTGGWNEVTPYQASWKRFFAWQERWLARHADAVTVASRTLETQVWGFGVDPARVFYMPNGPDISWRHHSTATESELEAVRTHLGVGASPFALYLGHIPHGTDLDLAIEAMVRLRNRAPEAMLVIAGVGEGLDRLKGLTRSLGITDRVRFPGWISREQAHIYLRAASVVVNPYRDTLINRSKCAGKLIAAMSVGQAVITSQLGENLAYIQDGQSGLLTEPGNVDELANEMCRVFNDPNLASDLGRAAQERIWAKYDWDARVADVECVYQVARRHRGLPA